MSDPYTTSSRKTIILLALDFILIGISLICLVYLFSIYNTISLPILFLFTFIIVIFSSTFRIISILRANK